MFKGIKVIILFIILVVITLSGWKMYRKLQYDELVFHSNIYDNIPITGVELVPISSLHNLEQYYNFNNGQKAILEPIKEGLGFPLVLCFRKDKSYLILSKPSAEKRIKIEERIKIEVAPSFPAKSIDVKGFELRSYALTPSSFIHHTTKNGILAISENYSFIEEFINTESESYFNLFAEQEDLEKLVQSSGISYYMNLNTQLLVLKLDTSGANMSLTGYVLNSIGKDSSKIDLNLSEELILPEDIYITSFELDEGKHPIEIKIELNKTETRTFD